MQQITPQEVGLCPTQLQKVSQLLQGYVQREQIAGAVALVARHGRVAYLEAVGEADREKGLPMQADTLFRIFSITKIITSVAALMLYEEGAFQLHDPVSDYIPEFGRVEVAVDPHHSTDVEPLKEPVRVHHLFTHTSGLAMEPSLRSPLAAAFREADLSNPQLSLEEMLSRRLSLPLLHQPGAQWGYGASSDALARLVEVVSGQPLAQFLEERIFRPLGMKDTGYEVPAGNRERLATVYGFRRGGLHPLETGVDSPYTRPRRLHLGSTGLVSTAPDLFRLAQALLNKGRWNDARLLGRKTVELMTRNHLDPKLLPYRLPWPNLEHYTRGCGFGLGVRVVMDVAAWGLLGSDGEYGWAGANNTFLWIDPVEEMVLLLMCQYVPFMHHPLDRQFKVAVYQALE